MTQKREGGLKSTQFSTRSRGAARAHPDGRTDDDDDDGDGDGGGGDTDGETTSRWWNPASDRFEKCAPKTDDDETNAREGNGK